MKKNNFNGRIEMNLKLLLCPIFLLSISGYVSATPVVTVSSYDNTEYKNPANSFNSYLTVYVAVALRDISSGDHNLTIDWIDPHGKVRAQSNKKFSVKESGYYQDMFSFKLPKLGRFTQMFEGSTYPRALLGTWTCRFFINGVMAKEYLFTMR